MASTIQTVSFSGAFLRRGFWLYIWEITTPNGTRMYYVGRTGDSSSQNAQSPFNRMSQHLGWNMKSNALRGRLEKKSVNPNDCEFRLVSYGPVLEEAKAGLLDVYRERRDIVASLEKDLAEAMRRAKYDVLNNVHCRMPAQPELASQVRAAFATHFPALLSGFGSTERAR
jgi:hypothetical protein